MPTYNDLCLSGGGALPGLVYPGRGMDSYTPVTPGANFHVLGSHLDDVFLPRIGIRDSVAGAI